MRFLLLPVIALFANAATAEIDGNRLAYLDSPSPDPFYPGPGFAKLVTPQWVGEEGVEAVAILSIDDMRDTAKYESYLRPILDRLKAIDGRAPLSIFTCEIDPADAQLQKWLAEGLSFEVHTIKHPCPLLGAGGTIDQARETVHTCIDLLAGIPNTAPVAFRMPCCDSQNSLSPRFFAEIFSKPTPVGNFLKADSSVFTLLNTPDKRLDKYLPRLRGFVGYIEDYPYPYVVGGNCWEFPCIVPSDWEAQDRHGPNNPETVADLKFALDRVVEMQGVFTLVFHPHGWIQNTQVVDLIDHAQKTHGKKIKFMTFPEAVARLEKNLLGGRPLREMRTYVWEGEERLREVVNGQVLDIDGDGYMDSFTLPNGEDKIYESQTRLWDPEEMTWGDPMPGEGAQDYRFGVLRDDRASQIYFDDGDLVLHFEAGKWQPPAAPPRIYWGDSRLLDIDGDGICEQLSFSRQAVYEFESGGLPEVERKGTGRKLRLFPRDGQQPAPAPLRSQVPESWELSTIEVPDRIQSGTGSRFVDLDADGDLDIIVSTPKDQAIYLFESKEIGWLKHSGGKREIVPEAKRIAPFVREDGSDNGAWIKRGRVYWQNEDTGAGQAQIVKRSFAELLALGEGDNDHPLLRSRPMTPEDSLAAIEVEAGLRVELVAAEPLVQDPIDIAWDADGNMWVVEMAGYPNGPPGGRVRKLTDIGSDGHFDHSELIASGLNFPTAVAPWRKGVLVVAAPDILYIPKRGPREVLYTGFREGNQQHRVNGLRWGLDNWLYLANGDSGGTIRSVKTGKEVELGGRDLRIRPDTGEIELCTGRTQFGRARDDWGDWFGCSNSQPLWHFVLPDRYLERNPHAASPSPIKHLFGVGGRPTVFPISSTLERFNDFDNANKITSACGANVYRDVLLGEEFAGDVFVCEPVHNLVVRLDLEPAGASFTAKRAGAEGGEFLRSKDNWFRPVSTRTGPDGALYVVDMYRHVIEHPEWIPPEWQAKLDLRAGKGRGRIYRVLPEGVERRNTKRLRLLPHDELARALEHPSGEVRDIWHQRILERDDEGATAQMRSVFESSRHAHARLHALCILAGKGQVTPGDIRAGLNDSHPGVRRHAVRIAERFATDAGLLDDLSALVSDPDPKVRQQLALSLGEWRDPGAGDLLAKLSKAEPDNRYLQAAVMSSAVPHAQALLKADTALERDKLERTASAPPAAPPTLAITRGPEIDRTDLAALQLHVRFEWREVDPAKADPERGGILFNAHCAGCHKYRGAGFEVGPDLEALTDRSTGALLTAILWPSAALEDKYTAHIARDNAGVVGSGLLAEETATTFTLLAAGGARMQLLRGSLTSIEDTRTSLMPDSYGQLLSKAQMSDLIAYLQQN